MLLKTMKSDKMRGVEVLNLKQLLRQDFNNKIRPLLIKQKCEICGEESDKLHLHHTIYFNSLLRNTLKELQLHHFEEEDYKEKYSIEEVEMIRNIMLGKQMRIDYITCCELCHLTLHKGSYYPTKLGKREDWSSKMIKIKKELKLLRNLQEQKRKEHEVVLYLDSQLANRIITKEQKEHFTKAIGIKDERGRLLKTPKAINKVLSDCGIDYEIKIKETSKMVEGKKVKIKYWIVIKLS